MEFKIITISNLQTHILTELHNQGYEIVSVTGSEETKRPYSHETYLTILLKRKPLEELREEKIKNIIDE
jgi:hypothetical protein